MKIALMCGLIVLGNRTTLPWTPEDSYVIKQAQLKCAQEPTKHPCLIGFIKTAKNQYRAVCGKQEKHKAKITSNEKEKDNVSESAIN